MEDKRILVVDDEMIIARDIERILKSMGIHQIRIANSSSEAIDISRKFRPHLILFDVNLEETKDGITSAAEIGSFMNVQVIYVTAHSNQSVLTKAMETNPANYIMKPFDQAQIEVALNDSQNHSFGTLRQAPYPELTSGEIRILKLIADNMKTKEIADELFLSSKTIENHRYNICKKLQLPPEKNSLIKWVYEHKVEIGNWQE